MTKTYLSRILESADKIAQYDAHAFHLLNVLLSPLKPVKEKEDILEKEFGIPIKQDYGEEVNQMCNLGEAIEEMGIAKGELKKLISQVRKKRDKGMNEAEIAEVLEEGQPLIHSIIQTLDEHEEDTDEQIAALFL